MHYDKFFSRLPAGLTQLRNLTHLGLNDVSLSWLPKDIGRYVVDHKDLKYSDRVVWANSVDPDQTASEGAV